VQPRKEGLEGKDTLNLKKSSRGRTERGCFPLGGCVLERVRRKGGKQEGGEKNLLLSRSQDSVEFVSAAASRIKRGKMKRRANLKDKSGPTSGTFGKEAKPSGRKGRTESRLGRKREELQESPETPAIKKKSCTGNKVNRDDHPLLGQRKTS